jgi:cyclic pyranopterin phosphate synthase
VQLKAAGLQRVTVSLDSLDPEVFKRMSGGIGQPDDVLSGIEAARRVGLDPLKVNTVVQRGVNDQGVLDLVERFRGTGVSVRFIEYMDVGNRNQWQKSLVVPSAELVAQISRRWPLLRADLAQGAEVAQRYVFADGQGEVGFVSSVSQPFCSACTRARLSSDGVLYTCLFATRGTSLRELLRSGASDEQVMASIARIWQTRSDQYSEQRGMLRLRRKSASQPKVEMNYIGG